MSSALRTDCNGFVSPILSLSDFAQSNEYLAMAGRACRRNVVLYDEPSNVLCRGHIGNLRIRSTPLILAEFAYKSQPKDDFIDGA